jgi:rhodanese-related sulfurtransferase
MKIRLLTLLAMFAFILVTNAQEIKQVKSTDVSALLQKDKKIVVLDVRTADEFKAGHIKGTINIDIRQPDAFSKIDKLDRNAKYIVHCRTNRRSKTAVDHMAQSGFKNISQITDGFSGWSENNLPVEK